MGVASPSVETHRNHDLMCFLLAEPLSAKHIWTNETILACGRGGQKACCSPPLKDAKELPAREVLEHQVHPLCCAAQVHAVELDDGRMVDILAVDRHMRGFSRFQTARKGWLPRDFVPSSFQSHATGTSDRRACRSRQDLPSRRPLTTSRKSCSSKRCPTSPRSARVRAAGHVPRAL